ncbi:ABC transporter permease subunit [Heliobacterium undosum]|uniref:ABC transporter permease subunit n=1 Tax=Heliomicrobium undosum TaxID=121734 RepID=A0A845L1G1_9FIRM|nr:ABC transporter permease subunit [Heliomicrobium undosum]MZP30347.1 ABC transporter permease subunit [Heliomicrobium undosum]
MFAIARLTFQEASKKRIFLLTLLLSAVFLALYGAALHLFAKEFAKIQSVPGSVQLIARQVMGQQLLGAGLYFSSFLLALLALLASVGSIASEIENGLLQAIVSKPMRRREIVLGKFLGYGILLTVYALLLYAGIMLLNGHYNHSALTALNTGSLLAGAAVFLLQPLLLLAVALLFSTLFRTLTAGIVSVMLYALSVIGGFLEQIGGLINRGDLINTGIAVSLIIPSDTLFRKLMNIVGGGDTNPLASLAAGPFGVTAPPSNLMLAYVGLYIVASLWLAIRVFDRKDL